ncbi:tail completion protein gp17 [Qipengyuania sediminis]|uniref:tail completion protein gp17 n=1 Tax=Qipengyuania sediminis TaxID=1532023 RepID=UPI00105A0A9D|nr:DUF3168 domain-containing protein [Qipengyuania sediminis]
MESLFRRDLLAWLSGDPALDAGLNAIAEESPIAAPPPWLGIAASASADWGAKGIAGREVRLALELTCRGDDPEAAAVLSGALERRVATLPAAQDGYRVVVTQFLRSRAERRKDNMRAMLTEWRFLLFAEPG